MDFFGYSPHLPLRLEISHVLMVPSEPNSIPLMQMSVKESFWNVGILVEGLEQDWKAESHANVNLLLFARDERQVTLKSH